MEFGAVGCARRCFSKERHFQSNKVVRSHYQQLLHRSEFSSQFGELFRPNFGSCKLEFNGQWNTGSNAVVVIKFLVITARLGEKASNSKTSSALLNVQNFRHVNLMAPKVNTKLNYLAIFIPLQLVAPLNRINNSLEMLSVSLCSNTRRVFGEF